MDFPHKKLNFERKTATITTRSICTSKNATFYHIYKAITYTTHTYKDYGFKGTQA
jgi:hypothetical protein